MSYFKLGVDNDVSYLLTEIGHNCRVNNIMAKAIINNTSMERTYDDKKIITHEELRRGQYIEYNDLFFIVLNEISDKRFLSYYKGIIRRCNYNIKFVLESKLYVFFSIIDGDKFDVNRGQLVNLSADTITVTLPSTEVTRKIKKGQRFIKFGQSWRVEGIDYTKKGLIILHCKAGEYDILIDDLEREIANVNELTENIVPIYPFDYETTPAKPDEPEEQEELIITGMNEISVWDTGFEYKINSNKEFIWTISNTTYARIGEQAGNNCFVIPNSNMKFGTTILRATLSTDETVFADKTIKIVYM